jgi:hypothetical protein
MNSASLGLFANTAAMLLLLLLLLISRLILEGHPGLVFPILNAECLSLKNI